METRGSSPALKGGVSAARTLMNSEWVKTEIREARKIEIKEGQRKLFPIRLVDFETIRDWECFDADSGTDLGVEIREYFMARRSPETLEK